MNNEYLIDYYSHYDEDSRTKSSHGGVEFATNMKYIRAYVPRGTEVLDVGAGTGVYSIALEKEGCSVRAIELVERNIEIFRSKLTGSENITLEQGNALDLSRFPDGRFDAVLLFGPMYHLYSKTDKLTALREARRVLKPDGHLCGLLHERGHRHPILLQGRRRQHAGLPRQRDADGGLQVRLHAFRPL